MRWIVIGKNPLVFTKVSCVSNSPDRTLSSKTYDKNGTIKTGNQAESQV